ncbi:phytoene desaturase family protein [Pseudactinotalea sp.]|uniref:phytoene desaturase family protein n=1 Tax=Pseudactinotalea sp. TaxID=1926260 RepID=UPI003B3BC642
MSEVTDAVVVGSGPNGLAAAVTLARAGLEVLVLEAAETPGGGARTLDLGLAPGLVHDICSAVHPLAVASPFFRAFDLAARGVDLVVPEVSYAQPLEGGRAGIAYTSLERTAEGLGADGAAWVDLFAPLVEGWRELIDLALGDRTSGMGSALAAAGPRAVLEVVARLLEQGSPAWNRRFSGEVAPALITGVAGHAIGRLPSPVAAGGMLMLGTLAHAVGWPIPVGGSGAISAAMLDDLQAHGGRLELGSPVQHWRDLPRARAYLFDTSAPGLAQIWGDRMPRRVRSALSGVRPGPAAAKVDFVLSGPVPWANPEVGLAGTVHLGGTRAEMAASEADAVAGRLSDNPLVLFSDPTVADPSRVVGGLRPVWAYAHVPNGCTVDPVELITRQIERYAPGFRDAVVHAQGIPASELANHNENYLGGDIALGALTTFSMVQRPRWAIDPYSAGIPGVYLCSSAASPGPGVHGMVGWWAARRALRDRFGRTGVPDLALSP